MNEKKTIEDIILMDSHRGMDELRPYLPEFYCEEAAKAILSWRRGPVLLATGFYVAGHAETDGPTGTVVLAKALQKLGFEPHILTDESCSHYFEPEGLDVIYMDVAEGNAFSEDLLKDLQPVGLISIERCGRNVKGDYANMHGESVRSHTARIDGLFDLAYGSVPTIGVGDGGNGEYWLDYPAPLRTRHLVVNLEETDPGQFRLRLRAGSKPDYLCDVLLGFLVLAAFWCLGKLFVPAPSFLYILGFIAAVATAAGLYVWSGKGFGGKETAALTEAVREAFHTEKA